MSRLFKMRAIFLDIDGVLNCRTSRSYCHDDECGLITGIDSDKVKRLAKTVEATNAKIVLSSDWRVGWVLNLTNREQEIPHGMNCMR